MFGGQNSNDRNIGYSVSYVMNSLESSYAVHGAQISVCEVLWTNGFALMNSARSYEHDPVFRVAPRSGLRSDFNDHEGNLVVRRSLSQFILLSQDRNEVRDDFSVFRVRPDGTFTVATNSYHTLQKYPIDNRNSIFQFDRFILTVGRGFGKHLDQIISHEKGADLNTLEAMGTYGRSLKGKWRINYERQAGHLVRAASFTAGKSDKPSFEIINSGLVGCPGLSLAASGSFTADGIIDLFEVQSLTNVNSFDNGPKSRYEKVLNHLDSRPSGGLDVFDHRESSPKYYHE